MWTIHGVKKALSQGVKEPPITIDQLPSKLDVVFDILRPMRYNLSMYHEWTRCTIE